MQICTQCGQAREAQAESCSGCGVAVSTGSKHILKRALCLLGCACWSLIGLGFGLFLIEYLFQGAGIHIFGISISSVSVLLGVVHVSGLALATLFSWALAIWLGACVVTSNKQNRREAE
ncbi:MAG: hypothetical protein ACO1QS_21005 [Verrucomicrobiota bacterium]